MPAVRGVTCSLRIEGNATNAPEYATQSEDDFASAYVVAEEDKRFVLDVATTIWVHSDLSIFVYMDGVYQTGVVWKGISLKEFPRNKVFNCKIEVDKTSNEHFEKIWKFDKLAVVDERVADCEQDFRVLSNIGTIEVVVLRCRPAHGDTQPLNDSPEDPHSHHKAYWKSWGKDRVRVAATAEKPSQPQSQAVFEKDIKGRGISHRVATEPEKPTTRRSAAFNYLDSFENPYCILVMQYRSRGALQNMGLIPQTPPQSPSPSPNRTPSPEITQDDLEEMKDLSREDMMRELLKYKKQESLKAGRKFKQEIREDNPEGPRRSKRAKKDEEKVVIDLTDD